MQELIKVATNANGQSQMMSSKRIAERTGKEHSNVLRDIRNMIGELFESQDSNLNSNEHEEVKAKNGMTAEILLNERLTLCLASGYSISLRMMIIDDWAKLKKSDTPKLPENYIEALEALVVSEKAKEQAITRAIEAEKTVTILTHDTKLLTTTEIAKELNISSANKLNEILNDKKIQYKINNTWCLYSKYANLGYVSIKQQVLDNGRVIYDRKWTQQGREFLIKMLGI